MNPTSPNVTLVGIPFDESSSFLRGPAEAPPKIREALHSPSANLATEAGRDLGAEDRFRDAGDLQLPTGAAAFGAIERGVAELLESGDRLLILGGDHAITYPVVRAFAGRYDRLTILHLDAHPDLYDELEGDKLSHACPFARIMEANLASRLVQLGIRTMTPHQRDQAERFGVEVVTAADWPADVLASLEVPLYLSLDLDVLDPAFAPGLSHHEPGGVSVRDVLKVIQAIQVPIVGADIVEYNPVRDLNGVTAMVAAKCMKEVADRMLSC
ncbi:MAG: agmatinase [Vicinamibacterales bacterium]|jgi:agmatinase|nr:agmatinase [Acidobacteriota bacterium]MDP7294901.1 agmatinase [Vicinamibacterales bacterium]MDP7672667.1 agmatinase [Vicinamibacterales bacterium]HJO38488.1 agmatinase [Vicinamibacterales bacterium]